LKNHVKKGDVCVSGEVAPRRRFDQSLLLRYCQCSSAALKMTAFHLTPLRFLLYYSLHVCLCLSIPCHSLSAVIAVSVIAWIGLIAVVVLHCLAFCMPQILPYLVEGITFCGLSVVWLLISIVASIYTNHAFYRYAYGYFIASTAPATAFAWISFLLHVGSAVLALVQSQRGGKQDHISTPHNVPSATEPGSSVNTYPLPANLLVPPPAPVQTV
jgi:hypothetical protein